ncbi:MAG: adenine phosphoribosyltransferase [Candidatus Entotheonellia bacterium]
MGPGSIEELKLKIRDIPDFPRQGIVFKDITPLLNDPRTFKQAIDAMAHPFIGRHIDRVVSIEARGFIVGAALAYILNAGLIPLRKPGKLPFLTHRMAYTLEYGSAELEIHRDAIKPGQRVIIVDDLLATGGTMRAAIDLVKTLEADIVGVAFLVELSFLQGRQQLQGHEICSLITY